MIFLPKIKNIRDFLKKIRKIPKKNYLSKTAFVFVFSERNHLVKVFLFLDVLSSITLSQQIREPDFGEIWPFTAEC